jgi:cytochrome P450 PksS
MSPVDPVKGSLMASSAFKANPYPFYARMRAEAPVFQVRTPIVKAWLITRYDDVVAMFRDERLSKDISPQARWLPRFAQPLTHHMLNRDPPDHTRLRGLVSQAFTPRRIEQLRGRVQALCDELLAGAPPGQPFDLLHAYALPIPLTVIGDLLGVPKEDRRRFHVLTRGTLSIGAPTGLFDVPKALPYLWLLMRYFRKLFEERRARPKEDMITALVQAEEAGDHLSETELLGTAILLLFAGYETTVNLIASGALELLRHPDQRARFVDDPAITETAVEELLRYTSPVEITPPRLAREDMELGPARVARGDFVAGVLGSANHDESQFDDPERLDIGREPNRHVSFGQGPHFCLGAALARLEAEVALTTLFRRCPGLRLARPADALRWRKMLPLRGLEELPVTF